MKKIREFVSGFCLYDPGKEEIRNLDFSDDPDIVIKRLNEVNEFRSILISETEFPIHHFIDILPALVKARVQGTYLEVFDLVNIRKVMESVRAILNFLKNDEKDLYPALKERAEDVKFFPVVFNRLNALLSKQGTIRDTASSELASVRSQLRQKEGSISKKLHRILENARKEGIVNEDVQLSIRNGRAVIPVSAGKKRKLDGYIHDESSSGQTVYIEPVAIVEANNELRELENREKREIIKILVDFTDFLRPYIEDLKQSHVFLAGIDSIRARARFALDVNAGIPVISSRAEIDWQVARHPLLLLSFRSSKREEDIVPLDIKLDEKARILVISGPNAGGKSVCLQTLGLLQYMFQSGFPVTVKETSVFGVFEGILLDMGDEQSIEDDLSTYSSHLMNMKAFLRSANEKCLILIDEFGSGTEPSLGAAISESVLENLNQSGTYGVITTHYTNLKHFAASQQGMVNGAMLFDTQKISPLYKLSVGKPGSSFAFEIARKIGLPESILKNAQAKIGQEHVDFDKHLKEIIRDKKYWENKRQRIRVNEKKLSELVLKYDEELSDTEKLRKRILKEAKDQAEHLLSEANRKIENTIREIKEAEAEKEKTRSIRKNLQTFRDQVEKNQVQDELKEETEDLRKKLEDVRRRTHKIKQKTGKPVQPSNKVVDQIIREGDKVIMKGQDTTGEVLSLKNTKAEVAFGNMKTTVKLELLKKISEERYHSSQKPKARKANLADWDVSKRKILFSPDIDVRGKRAEEALRIITDFIDEAIMVQAHDLRILHGKGNGILRELIRQHLSVNDMISWFGDEHVENGGAGITVVKLSQ